MLPEPVRAHEPLWGEAASTVGDRVIHPDVRFAIRPSHRLLNGTGTVANPTGLSLSRVDQSTAVDYGIGPRLNIRLDIPVANMSMRQTVAGVPVRASFTELGDVLLGGKYRFYLKSGRGTKSQQSFFITNVRNAKVGGPVSLRTCVMQKSAVLFHYERA
jgi:hypothetical protein